jgi:hypothetical protein
MVSVADKSPCHDIFATQLGGIAQLVERLVRNDCLTNPPILSQVLSSTFSEVKPRRDVVRSILKYAQIFSRVDKEVDKKSENGRHAAIGDIID